MLKYLRYNKNKRQKRSPIKWEEAPDVRVSLDNIITKIKADWIKKEDIFTLRSLGSKSRAVARIWGLSKVWQTVLKVKPVYIVEVISERYDRMSEPEKNKVLIHEIAHIPKNFSGALIPHFKKGRHKFKDLVNNLTNHAKGHL